MSAESGGTVDVQGSSLGAQAMRAVESGGVEPGGEPSAATELSSEGEEIAPSAQQGGGEVTEASAEAAAKNEIDDLIAHFSEGKPQQDDADDLDIDDDGVDEPGQQGSRAQRRIRSLSGKVKELSGTNEQLQLQVQQQQQQFAQAGQAYRKQQLQLQKMQLNMARMEERSRLNRPAESDDPAERFWAEKRGELIKASENKLSPQVRAAYQRIQKMEQELQRRDREAQSRERRATYSQAVDSAYERHFKNELPAEEFQKLRGVLGNRIMGTAYEMGGNPDFDSAAQALKTSLNSYFVARLNHWRQSSGAKVAQSQDTPKPAPAGTPGAKASTSWPTKAKLKQHGYRDWVQWQIAGEPMLT